MLNVTRSFIGTKKIPQTTTIKDEYENITMTAVMATTANREVYSAVALI